MPWPVRRLSAARAAVGVLFFVNALALTTVLPRLPQIKADLGLANTALGLALAAAPVGSLVAVPLTGRLIARYGSAPVAATAGTVLGLGLPLLAVAPSGSALAATYLALGAADGMMDAAMNAHALRVQQRYGRSLIHGMHGLWSVGAAAGAATGTAAAAFGVPLALHLGAVGLLTVGGAAAAAVGRLPGPDPADLTAHGPDGGVAAGSEGVAGGGRPGGVRAALRALLWVGALSVLAGMGEDVAGTWSTVYLADGRGAAPGIAGLGYTFFAVAMALSRFTADRVTDRIGVVAVARAGGLLAMLGYALVLASPTLGMAIVGFAVIGLGVAPAFPALFHAAGHWPGVRSGDGVTVVSWVARMGFLVTPPLVGLVADTAGIAAGLVLGGVAAGAYGLLAGRLRAGAGR